MYCLCTRCINVNSVQVRSKFGKFTYTAICMRKCTLWSDNTCVFTRFHSVKNANTQLIWCSADMLNLLTNLTSSVIVEYSLVTCLIIASAHVPTGKADWTNSWKAVTITHNLVHTDFSCPSLWVKSTALLSVKTKL